MKKFLGLSVLLILVLGTVFGLKSLRVHASDNDYLLSDGVFDNVNSMSAAQIDSWLNTFPNSCISSNNGFTASDPTGYSPNSSYIDGHYTYGSPVTAGTVIHDAAVGHSISPEVLLTKLQNEEQLVDGSAGCSSWRYASAVGYSCTDSGSNSHNYTYTGADAYSDSSALLTPLYYINNNPVNSITGSCVSANVKAGFSEQVVHAAWFLSYSRHKSEGQTGWAAITGNWNHCDDNATCPAGYGIPDSWACYYGLMTQGNFKRCPTDSSTVYYDGYDTIDGQSLHMDTGATAALYYYTPHIQSFDSIFTPWFGSPRGLDYDYQYVGVSFSGASTSANVQGNTQVTVTLTAENTGNQSWSNTNYPVRIGTWSPTNHQSALYDSSWYSYDRPATLTQPVVQPGQNGTFTFKINVPNRSGSYEEMFNLVAEGAAWMSSGFELNLNITPSVYSWSMTSQSSSNGWTLLPGQTSQLTLQAKNTGNVTWTNSGNPVRLATWNPPYRNSPFCSDNTNWVAGCYRAATLQESSVAPGGTGTFVFTVQAPQKEGFYAERYNLVMEGISWFQDPWMEFDINVKRITTWHMVSEASSVGWTLNKGQLAQFTLVAHNDGNMTWTNSGNPVRLATWNPPYRISPFCSDNTNWVMGCVRAATLQEASVPPGQNGTFVFTVQAPQKSGSYAERFNLVMEGVTWFTDPWLEFDVTVK